VASEHVSLPRLFSAQPPPFRADGKRVSLRSPDRRDWQAWTELREEARGFLAPWEPSWSADALERGAFRRRLARYAVDWRTDQGYSFLLFRTSDNALLGGIGISNVRRGVAETGSLGYWIGERHARNGYMTEGLQLVLAFAFQRARLHRLEAACLPHNLPSRRLLERGGFREEGQAREYLCIDGRWQDHVLFGLLRAEWEASRR
jgi:[ribosomal protein S5]-alanine N-acetyltransferase